MVSDLSLNTDRTHEISCRDLLAIMFICGDQLMSGVTLTPKSLTISVDVISVPSGVEYSMNWL